MKPFGAIKITRRNHDLSGTLQEKPSDRYSLCSASLRVMQEIGFDEKGRKFYRNLKAEPSMLDDKRGIPIPKIWSNWIFIKNYKKLEDPIYLSEITPASVKKLTEKIQKVVQAGLSKAAQEEEIIKKSQARKAPSLKALEMIFNAITTLSKPSHSSADFEQNVVMARQNLKNKLSPAKMEIFEIGVSSARAKQNWPASSRYRGNGG